MISLHDFISKRINKVFLYPTIIAIILFFIIIFNFAYNQAEKNRVLIKKSILKSFSEISVQVSDRFDISYEHFSMEVNSVKQSAQKILEKPHIDSFTDNDFISTDGFFILNKKDIVSSIYTTRLKTLSKKDKQILHAMSVLDIQIDSIISQYKDKIDTLWINIGENYSMFYPSIDVTNDLQSNLDPRQYRYYYLADYKHNPKKENVFIELFDEDWALNIGQIGAIVSPIYVKNEFKGVVGIALNSANMQTFSDLDLPYDSYVIVTDVDGHVLVASNEEEFKKDFMINSFYEMHKSVKHKKLEAINIDKIDKNIYETFSKKLKGTNLTMTLVAKDKKIGAEVFELFLESRKIGIIIFSIAILFIVFLFFYGKIKIKKLSNIISEPMNDLASASNHLTDEKSFNFDKSNIVEIEYINSNLSNAHKRLLKQLYFDTETNLGNKQKLLNDLQNNSVLSLVSLDNYRMISTIYGPQIGLIIIKKLAFDIESMLSKSCKMYRLYNDTFAFIIVDANKNNDIAKDRINTFYENISNHEVKIDGVDVSISYSIGYCSADDSSEYSPLARAELALEDAKHHEHKKVVKYDNVLHASSIFKENLEWARKLHNAFDEKNTKYKLEPFFQAIYNFKNKKVKKFEMLVRMIDGEKIISPFFFLPAAAQMGKLPDITRFMFDELLKVTQIYKDVEFSVNTSFEDFEDAGLLAYVKEKISQVDVNTSNIIIEILETGEFRDEKLVINTIKELKNLGFKIAIDDFGAGNSNFAHLMLMKVDYIKIDGQFIKNIVNDVQSQNITKTIKEFAKLTGAKTIAEFVKDSEIFEYVKDLDIDYAQGYFISEPIPAFKLGEVLTYTEPF